MLEVCDGFLVVEEFVPDCRLGFVYHGRSPWSKSDRQTDRRTDRSVLGAAWSQANKNYQLNCNTPA